MRVIEKTSWSASSDVSVLPVIPCFVLDTTSTEFWYVTTSGSTKVSSGGGAVSGVKGDAESTYRTGNVNLTSADIGALPLSGGNMTGNISWLNGGNRLYWKEGRFGDQFAFQPAFNGADDANLMKLQGAVGDIDTSPALYDLATVSGKSGNLWMKGDISYGGRLHMNMAAGSWIDMRNMTKAAVNVDTQIDTGGGTFRPIMLGKFTDGHWWGFGGISKRLGFYYWLSTRTANGNDGSIEFDPVNGNVYANGTELSKVNHTHSYLPLSGGKMTGRLSFANATAMPNASTSTDFYVVGFQAYNQGGGVWYKDLTRMKSWLGVGTSSDRRLKSDIEPIGDDAVEFIESLKPSVYTINGERQVGLIAQDVHDSDPWGTNMAFEAGEGVGIEDWEKIPDGSPTWKLDYIRIIPPLVAAVQSANKHVESLEAEVTDLRTLVLDLTKMEK